MATWLGAHIPAGDAAGVYGGSGSRLLHGDYRMDNLVFAADSCSVVIGVLDWELASLGDPRADLAYLCLPFHLPATGLLRPFSLLGDRRSDGIPTERELMAAYYSDAQPSSPSEGEWVFFLALGLFRMACIASGVFARAVQGNAVGETAREFEGVVSVLSSEALRMASTHADAAKGVESVPSIMGFRLCELGQELLKKLRDFNRRHVAPTEKELLLHYQTSDGKWPTRGEKWRRHPLIDSLIARAKAEGLWNLWVTVEVERRLKTAFPDWPWNELLPHGRALSQVSYMYLAMESGRFVFTPLLINWCDALRSCHLK